MLIVYSPSDYSEWEMVEGSNSQAACPYCGEAVGNHQPSPTLRAQGVESSTQGCGRFVGTPRDVGY